MDFIPLAIPFLALLLAELLWSRLSGRNAFSFADTLCSLSMGTLSRLRGFLVLGVSGMAWAQLEARALAWPLDHPVSWFRLHRLRPVTTWRTGRASGEYSLGLHVAHHQSEPTTSRPFGKRARVSYVLFYLPMLP